MGTRIQFVCQSLACRRQVEIEVPTGNGVGDALEMLCICGLEMERSIRSLSFRKLSRAEGILRLGDSVLLKTHGKPAG